MIKLELDTEPECNCHDAVEPHMELLLCTIHNQLELRIDGKPHQISLLLAFAMIQALQTAAIEVIKDNARADK